MLPPLIVDSPHQQSNLVEETPLLLLLLHEHDLIRVMGSMCAHPHAILRHLLQASKNPEEIAAVMKEHVEKMVAERLGSVRRQLGIPEPSRSMRWVCSAHRGLWVCIWL
jgi:hypothetical protein